MGSIFAISYNLSGLLSPIIGSSFYKLNGVTNKEILASEKKAWSYLLQTNAIIEFCIAGLYLIFNSGRVFNDARELSDDLKELKKVSTQIK